ncbi:LacI family DNA-binding transcriptional regulator [Gracilibacillus phocaeensis]|uniref:LacI family DNA-binding transcriptional regulator n=1 Tax=Gracilibacillus phocaeensis TaxID=2042304 RepID=UPI001030D6CD|nr:LacI family DNA-binding transcriptional regulator [Gracilibacillus phocaeensis]
MTSLKKIAEQANVSVATVSNVLNKRGRVGEETRKKILRLAEELNYAPNRVAKSLKMNKSQTIGVIVEDLSVFNAPEIIDGINAYAEEQGYSILLMNLRMKKKTGQQYPDAEVCKKEALPMFKVLLASQVEGIIYVGIHLRDVQGILPESNIPIVYTYCDTSHAEHMSVNYHDWQAAYDAVTHLITNAYQDIGVITGLKNSESTTQRLKGFKQALQDNQLVEQEQWIKNGDWSFVSGYEQGKSLLGKNEKPQAVFAMNDAMAAGVLKVAAEMGLQVPQDVAIIGFDNIEAAEYLTPRLTTVSLPLNEMGRQSIGMLLKQINGAPIQQKKVRLQCQLICRESS